MTYRTLAAIAFAALLAGGAAVKTAQALEFIPADQAQVQENNSSGDDRLLIVNGNTGHVIYDDGRDDLFCVTRRVVIGYNEYGYPVRKRIMKCR